MNYYDKNGNEIRAGMVLVNESGEQWVVCRTISSLTGSPDLGLSCNAYEAYPLWQFDMSEWEIREDIE